MPLSDKQHYFGKSFKQLSRIIVRRRNPTIFHDLAGSHKGLMHLQNFPKSLRPYFSSLVSLAGASLLKSYRSKPASICVATLSRHGFLALDQKVDTVLHFMPDKHHLVIVLWSYEQKKEVQASLEKMNSLDKRLSFCLL